MGLNSKNFFAVIISVLSIYNLANILPAAATSFTFNRTYKDFGKYIISGKFVAEDMNNNQIISAEEVSEFSLTFKEIDSMYGSSIEDQISVEEPKEIREFEYKIGTDNLSFLVNTTGRNAQDPEGCAIFGCESSAWIDFSRKEDSYFITDYGLILSDSDGTGRVNQTTPEPNSMAAILLVGLAWWNRRCCRR